MDSGMKEFLFLSALAMISIVAATSNNEDLVETLNRLIDKAGRDHLMEGTYMYYWPQLRAAGLGNSCTTTRCQDPLQCEKKLEIYAQGVCRTCIREGYRCSTQKYLQKWNCCNRMTCIAPINLAKVQDGEAKMKSAYGFFTRCMDLSKEEGSGEGSGEL